MTHYLIYKITNLTNGKFYIGKHITDNLEDNYWGSGLHVKRAIQKHGIENFVFTILIDLKNEEELNLLEELVVNKDFVKRPDTYNMKVGGVGGWGSGENSPWFGKTPWNKGKHHTEATKAKLSKASSGKNNSRYGYHFSAEEKQRMSGIIKDKMRMHNSGEHISKVKKAMFASMSEEERRQRTSCMANAVRGKKYWTNGEQCILSKDCPGDGWTVGFSQERKYINKLAQLKAATRRRLLQILHIWICSI